MRDLFGAWNDDSGYDDTVGVATDHTERVLVELFDTDEADGAILIAAPVLTRDHRRNDDLVLRNDIETVLTAIGSTEPAEGSDAVPVSLERDLHMLTGLDRARDGRKPCCVHNVLFLLS